ncbi:MAG: flagellar basal body rod protein FlgC [Desulfobacterales bacterium]|nr:flagellar basal body rod protein FlgC [Desulfobacterales bacterium]
MKLLDSLDISKSALQANRVKLSVISENLANSETTRTKEGGPYRRKMVVFESSPTNNDFKSTLNTIRKEQSSGDGVKVSEIVRSQEDFVLVHNPDHPDADPQTGYVAMPNVNHLTEMTDMILARRAYDANVTVISNTKSMILKALEIGK